MMVGRELGGRPSPLIRNLARPSCRDNLASGTKVIDASFELRRGEVLGIAGLIGAGRTELLRLIAGADAPTAGSITPERPQLTERGSRAPRSPPASASLPEERKREGIIPQRSVVSNIALASMRRFAPRGFIAAAAPQEATEILTRSQPAAAPDRPADPPFLAAATSRRRSSAAGSRRIARSCCSTSRRAASTSARRPKSTA